MVTSPPRSGVVSQNLWIADKIHYRALNFDRDTTGLEVAGFKKMLQIPDRSTVKTINRYDDRRHKYQGIATNTLADLV
jgi:hypothetical protein